MKNLKRVLAVTDFSPLGDAAAHRGALLAARENSEFLIAHAIPGESALNRAFGSTGGLPARMRAVAEARLAALVQAARDLGVRRVRAEIVEGATQRTVADMTDRYEPDLLVIGAHGKGLRQQMFLGGTASRILAHIDCPVLVTRRRPRGDYQRTLTGVDLGPISDVVLRAALAVASQASITVAHVYQAPFEAKLRYKYFTEDDIAPYVKNAALAAERSMAALLAEPDIAGLNLKSLLIHGNPVSMLSQATKTLQADLIVAGKQGGSRLNEIVLGSVTRFLAYYAPCDVLVV